MDLIWMSNEKRDERSVCFLPGDLFFRRRDHLQLKFDIRISIWAKQNSFKYRFETRIKTEFIRKSRQHNFSKAATKQKVAFCIFRVSRRFNSRLTETSVVAKKIVEMETVTFLIKQFHAYKFAKRKL